MRLLSRTIDYWLPSGITQQQATLHFGSGLPAPWLRLREEKVLQTIAQWADQCDRHAYGSISGGKDSLVMAHLIRQVWPDCPFCWVNQGPLAEWPDCLLLLLHLIDQGWNIVEICPPVSLLQLYREHGVPLAGHMGTKLDRIINNRLMYAPLADYQEQQQTKGYAWGLRRDEARGRRKFLLTHNTLMQRKDKTWVCSPVGFWTTKEIWQYIDAHQLPYPAMYDRDRMTVRNGPPIGTTGVNWGRLSSLRLHHPNLWAEFVAEFPELRNHSG